MLLALLLSLPPALHAGDFGYSFNYPDTNTITIVAYVGPGGSLAIPSAIDGFLVTDIGTRAFEGCTSLNSVTIPNTVTTIGYAAFLYCINITNVMIPNSVVSMGAGAFEYCYSLSAITIGNSLTNIEVQAFDGCTNLISVVIPDSVTSIGDNAFYECLNLTNVTIGNSVKRIGSLVFVDCKLTSITIPDSVTSIGGGAFASCRNLASVTIGNSVTNIGTYAFGQCYDLMGIYFRSNAPSLDLNVFYGDNNATAYYLPGTKVWGTTFGDCPTALWLPMVKIGDSNFGIQTNQFGFNLNWASGQTVVVEACTNLSYPNWQPAQTYTLTNGTAYFRDPQWMNYPSRFYRLRSP